MVSDNPIDLFRVGDHIEVVYENSKHFGRTGIITKVCDPRLSIRFDDPRPGSYVHYHYARLRIGRGTTRHDNDISFENHVTVVPEDVVRGDNTLVSLMENLVIQTAVSALSEANDMADVEKAIDEQADCIRIQARRLLRRRNADRGTS
jgi:hypothetical protein